MSTKLTRQIRMFTHDVLCISLLGLYRAPLSASDLNGSTSRAQVELRKLSGEN